MSDSTKALFPEAIVWNTGQGRPPLLRLPPPRSMSQPISPESLISNRQSRPTIPPSCASCMLNDAADVEN